jgi:dipeptidyl aminopeptidase/acylaminoacyl peptidase
MRILYILIIFLVNPPHLSAQSQQVPLEAYGNLPSRSMVVISPDAQRMAYRDTSDGRDLMLILNIKKKALLAAIDISLVNPDNAYFIDNDRLIFFSSKNKRLWGFKGRHDVSTAHVYNLKSKKIHQLLVPGYGIYQGQSQLGKIIGISSDKRFAYMPAYKNAGSYNLYKVSLERRRKPILYSRGTDDTIDFFLDESGEVIARERYDNESNKHSIEARVGADWKEIFSDETPYRTKDFKGVTPDRQSLVMLKQENKHGRWSYYTMSLLTGKVSPPIFSHKNKDVEHVLTDLQRVVHGVQYSGFSPTYEFFNEKINARMRGLDKALPNNTFKIADYTPDWKSMVFYLEGELSSGDYLLYQNGALKLLASARPEIPGNAVHPAHEYYFTSRDGLIIPTLITSPEGKTAKNFPAIMLPHGGPESYDKLGFNWMTQYFASRGYVVIQPQFRGSKGFGATHLLSGRGEWGRKMQDDLTDAVSHLAKEGMIDKNRVCIVGASYGGYAALAGVSFTPDLYKCAVSINGVFDIEKMLQTEKREYGNNHWVVSYWKDVISKGDINEDYLEQISPINHVMKIKAPVLLIHGELDQTVPIKQSKNMYDELDDAKKEVTFIELEEGNHNLSKSVNRLKALQAMDQFIKQFI